MVDTQTSKLRVLYDYKNNLNLIRVIKPYFSSTIIFQVEADVVAKNFTQLLDSFVISF